MAAERPSLADQAEELELSYLERRNELREGERRGLYSGQIAEGKQRRLTRLRAARETLYRFAEESGGRIPVERQDRA